MADRDPHRVAVEKPDEAALDNAFALAELRKLLVEPEQRDIAAIRERIENPEIRAEDISGVIAEAIELRRRQEGQAVSRAITPSVEEALHASVRKDPQVLADALFPVMGPAIRKSIAEALSAMLESFNTALEHSVSVQGLRWRWESFRTGKPFAEIVLLHSLVYRVEQVFLIHRTTGLQLLHMAAPEVASQDPDLVAGMFSAIQDFVRDSFHAPAGQSLDSLRVGDLQVWVEEGPYASIAAVIRGHAPADYRTTLREALETIHREYSEALEGFDGDSATLQGATPQLEACLLAHYLKHARRRRKPYFLISAATIVVAVLALWIGIRAWQTHNWGQFVDALGRQPGFVVTSWERVGNRFQIRGLRDPLAADPAQLLAEHRLDPARADFVWASYYALDDAILEKRIAAAVSPPPSARLSVVGGIVRAQGEVPAEWISTLQGRLAVVPGIRGLDISALTDADRAEFERRKSAIIETLILFAPGSAEVPAEQVGRLQVLVSDVQQLLARAARLKEPTILEVVGHCDSTGTDATNVFLSRQRADGILRELVRQGVRPQQLRPRGAGTKEPVRVGENAEQYNRSVTFRVVGGGQEPAR